MEAGRVLSPKLPLFTARLILVLSLAILSAFSLSGCFFSYHQAVMTFKSQYNLLPIFSGSTPASPAANNEPTITGTSEPGATVTLYSDSTCTQVLTSGTVDSSGNFSIPTMVAAGATTNIYAKANDGSGNVSSCTSVPLTYTENSTCSGSFVPMISQHGGGNETTGNAIIHGSCASFTAGSNSINSSGSGFLTNATEYGSGGSPSTSVFVSKYDYKGYLLWTSEYAETNADASVAGMVQDSSGNLYVAGTVSCVSGQTCSFGGTVSGTSGLNANGNSNVYVMKFDSNGVFQWVTQLGGGTIASGQSIMAKAVAIDGSGNVYVTGGAYNVVGTQLGSHGQIDSFVTKVTSSGSISWTSQMGNGGTSDYIGYGIAIDSSGHVDVAGSAQGALLANQLSVSAHGFNDVFINQLSSTGGNDWYYQIGNGGDMWGTSVVTDSSNNIYISGYTDGLLTPSPISATLYGTHGVKDTYLMEFNSTGSYQWTKQYGTEHAAMTLGLLGGNNLSMDSSNEFYLVGSADGYLGGSCYNNCGVGTSDTFVQKMASTGAFDWVTQIGGTGDGTGNSVGDVAITSDSSGNSYISSLTNSVMSYLFGTHKVDNLVTTVDSTGAFDANTSTAPSASTPYWPVQQGANATVDGYGLVQDSSGNIWVTGDTTGSVVTSPGQQFGSQGTHDTYLSKFDSSGNLKCTDELGASGSSTYGSGVIADSVSGFDVVGSTNGTVGTQLGTHGTQDVFIANFPGCGGTPSVIQYGASSATVSGIGISQYQGNLFVTGSTNVYLGGTQTGTLGTKDVYLAKFTSGTLSWANQLGASGATTNSEGLVSDGAGNFYITGSTTGSLGGTQFGSHGSEDLFLAKYDSTGAFQWVIQLGVSSKNTVGWELTMDGSNIVVVGYTTGNLSGATQDGYHGSQDIVVASFTSAGAENWVHQLGTEVPCLGGEACNGFLSGSTTGTGIVADSSGNIYVTGYATGLGKSDTQYGSHGVDDAILAEYSSTGTFNWMSNYGLTAATTYGWNITLSKVSPRKVLISGTTNGFLGGTQYGTQSTDMFILGADSSGVMP